MSYEQAARAASNRTFVRELLWKKEPELAAQLEWAVDYPVCVCEKVAA
jgi:hypothetical protein